MSGLVFQASNVHVEGCGAPPAIITEDRADKYHGYYENEHGEQWVFEFDHASQTATLYGGDIQWDEPKTLKAGEVSDLIVGQPEYFWINTCWITAHRQRSVSPVPKCPVLSKPEMMEHMGFVQKNGGWVRGPEHSSHRKNQTA